MTTFTRSQTIARLVAGAAFESSPPQRSAAVWLLDPGTEWLLTKILASGHVLHDTGSDRSYFDWFGLASGLEDGRLGYLSSGERRGLELATSLAGGGYRVDLSDLVALGASDGRRFLWAVATACRWIVDAPAD